MAQASAILLPHWVASIFQSHFMVQDSYKSAMHSSEQERWKDSKNRTPLPFKDISKGCTQISAREVGKDSFVLFFLVS